MLSRLKVATKLLGVIGIVVVAASVAIGLFVFRGAEQTIEAQTRAQLETERDSRAALVAAYFRRIHDQLGISSRQLVTQIALREMPSTVAASPDAARLHALFDPYAHGLEQAFGYHDVLLIGLDGRVLYSMAGRTNRDGGVAQAYTQANAAAADSVQFVDYTIDASGSPAAFASTPVFDTTSTSRLGVLVFMLSVDELSAIMTDAAGVGSTGETYLLGPDLLMRTNTRFAQSPLKLRIETPGGRRAVAGETGTIEQIDYRGTPVFAAYAPIDILGARWAIVVKTDVNEALAPIRQFRMRSLLLLAVVSLVAGFVLWESLRRIVLDPVAALAAGARRVGARDYGRPVGLTGHDELGQLGQSFDGMMASVGATVDELSRARAAEKRGQQLLEIAPDGVVAVDAHGNIVVVNAAAEQMFGYRRDELFGQKIELLVPDSARDHVARREAYVAKPVSRAMGSTADLWARRKDGSQLPVEISLSPLDSPDGLLVIAVVRDITERREAQRNLKESEERLEAAARGANLGLWDVDAATGTILVNAIFESQLGYPRGGIRESDGKWARLRGGLAGWTHYIHPDDRARVEDLVARYLSGELPVYVIEHRVRKHDGSYCWILSIGNSAQRDAQGRPLRVNGVHIDTTDRKGLEELRDGLVHMIVHDLRSPLNSVLGYIDLLRTEENISHADRDKFTGYAYDGASQMIEMVSSLLDINRMEANEMPIDRQRVDLCGIASEAVKSLGGLTIGRNVSEANPDGVVESNCDPALIRRVIANLLGNALKFTPESGSITITVSRVDGKPQVEVADTGPGIPADFLGRVFEKFTQAGEGRAKKRYSTGLGLNFCKLAVEAHGGTIGVTSEVGKGSRFYFQLPE